MCGGTTLTPARSTAYRGLSPRVRGNLPTLARDEIERGSIPACAGEPSQWRFRPTAGGVYPRVCGGTTRVANVSYEGQGLSPRVRGNHGTKCGYCGMKGSIPACAGEPSPDRTPTQRLGVYPRVCGGTGFWYLVSGIWGGSIPACAGEPANSRRVLIARRVYPRVCGGTHGVRSASERAEGLSPRVRGNPGDITYRTLAGGSIPACAGEPRRPGFQRSQ